MNDLRSRLSKPSSRMVLLAVVGLIICGVIAITLFNRESGKKTADTASSTSSQPKTNSTLATNQATNSQSPHSNPAPPVAPAKSAPGYLVISQWGIKVKLGSANPTLVTYTTMSANECGGTMTGNFTSCVELALKSSVTAIPLCEELGVGIGRQPVSSFNAQELRQASAHVVGKYVYMPTGNPYPCGNQKLDSIREKYTGDNANKWTYSND